MAIFVVDTSADTTDDDGLFSLREAIEASNATPGSDLIKFDASLAGTPIVLSSDLPAIESSVRIVGDNGITIDGAREHNIFNISGEDDLRVVIKDLILIDPMPHAVWIQSEDNSVSLVNLSLKVRDDDAIKVDGDDTDLTIRRSVVNLTEGAFDDVDGIDSNGENVHLKITGSTFVGNPDLDDSDGIELDGDGSSVIIWNSTFENMPYGVTVDESIGSDVRIYGSSFESTSIDGTGISYIGVDDGGDDFYLLVARSYFGGNGEDGISFGEGAGVDGGSFVVRNSVFDGNGDGIDLDELTANVDGLIWRSEFLDQEDDAIEQGSTSSEVSVYASLFAGNDTNFDGAGPIFEANNIFV
ncbi:hypothetical protein [Acuticoccus kandeliae]|uniref:hypothetical protein n=1 Tax=Acuticoccus kandeliae TaxID=2073160 RepID=UPI000D3E31A6|nr:hypothetical protein [Acuticoccus kandeliae]